MIQIHDLSKHPKQFLFNKKKIQIDLFNKNIKFILVPVVRVTSVRPIVRVSKLAGVLISYQSFFEKGSALQDNYLIEIFQNKIF